MQLPKKPHSPQSYKKNRIYKTPIQVNNPTGQQVKKIARFGVEGQVASQTNGKNLKIAILNYR